MTRLSNCRADSNEAAVCGPKTSLVIGTRAIEEESLWSSSCQNVKPSRTMTVLQCSVYGTARRMVKPRMDTRLLLASSGKRF